MSSLTGLAEGVSCTLHTLPVSQGAIEASFAHNTEHTLHAHGLPTKCPDVSGGGLYVCIGVSKLTPYRDRANTSGKVSDMSIIPIRNLTREMKIRRESMATHLYLP